MNGIVRPAFAIAVASLLACGGGSSTSSGGNGGTGGTGDTTVMCDSIDGAYVMTPGTAGTSNSTCNAVANGAQANDSLVYTITTSGNAITISQPGKASMQGSIDRAACTATASANISLPTTDSNGNAVTLTMAEHVTLNFASNTSMTSSSTGTVSASLPEVGLPCTLSGTSSGTKAGPPTCSQSVFQTWSVRSFTPSFAGASPLSPINLAGMHYGPGQSVVVTNAGTPVCTLTLDVERTRIGIPEQGTFSLTNPTPASSYYSSYCMGLAVTGTYSLNCSTLTVTTAAGVGVYGSP